ncbi:MAG: MCE family protein [Deltaproteobacteria bacterium]|nr:MCE family protein [Deltaproteobacteria bacterium]
MKYRFLDQIVGAFLVFILILVVVSVVTIGRGKAWFKRYDTYYAVFKEGYGLQPGSKVKMLEIEVGRVKSIDIDESNQVRLTLKIVEEVGPKIKTDSLLAVEGTPILGSSYLSLTPGTPSGNVLPIQSRIPSEDKKSLQDYLDYLSSLALEEKFATLTRILADISEITHQLKDPDGPLFGLLSEVRSTVSGLRNGEGTAGKLLKDDRLYLSINERIEEVKPVLSNFDRTSQRLVTVSAQVERMLADLEETASSLPQIMANVDATTKALPLLIQEVRDTVAEVSPVLRGARGTLKDTEAVVKSLKNNRLIRMNLPAQEVERPMELDLRGVEP